MKALLKKMLTELRRIMFTNLVDSIGKKIPRVEIERLCDHLNLGHRGASSSRQPGMHNLSAQADFVSKLRTRKTMGQSQGL